MKARVINQVRSLVPTQYQTLYSRVTAGKAPPKACIKLMCLECVGYVKNEVTLCTAARCPLFRHRPFQKKRVRSKPKVENPCVLPGEPDAGSTSGSAL